MTMIVRLRCLSCSGILESELAELHDRIDDAAEVARRDNNDAVVILCGKCMTRHFPEFVKAT